MKGLNVVLPLLCLTVTALAPAAVTAQDCVTCADGQLDVCKDPDQNPNGWAHWALDLNNSGQMHEENEGTHNYYYSFRG